MVDPLSPGQISLTKLTAGHPEAVQALRESRELRAEVIAIAADGVLPDGDSVNMPTLL